MKIGFLRRPKQFRVIFYLDLTSFSNWKAKQSRTPNVCVLLRKPELSWWLFKVFIKTKVEKFLAKIRKFADFTKEICWDCQKDMVKNDPLCIQGSRVGGLLTWGAVWPEASSDPTQCNQANILWSLHSNAQWPTFQNFVQKSRNHFHPN